MSGGHACESRCKKHDVPLIATVTDSVYCAVCEHAEAERLREELHDAGGGDTWRAACLRVTAELEISLQRLAAAEAETKRLRDEVSDLEDCREHLRRLGEISGCDHCDSSDERIVQVSHIKRAFERLADDNDELRQKLTETNAKLVAVFSECDEKSTQLRAANKTARELAAQLSAAEALLRKLCEPVAQTPEEDAFYKKYDREWEAKVIAEQVTEARDE